MQPLPVPGPTCEDDAQKSNAYQASLDGKTRLETRGWWLRRRGQEGQRTAGVTILQRVCEPAATLQRAWTYFARGALKSPTQKTYTPDFRKFSQNKSPPFRRALDLHTGRDLLALR